jgi:hypothetical protein
VPALDAVWLTMADMMGGMAQGGGHDMAAMGHGSMVGMNHAGMASMQGMGGGHDMSAMGSMPGMAHSMASNPLQKPGTTVRHARTEWGPGADMRVDMPRTNLDDPGIGLRDNGRRVLTLADLKTVGGSLYAGGPSAKSSCI